MADKGDIPKPEQTPPPSDIQSESKWGFLRRRLREKEAQQKARFEKDKGPKGVPVSAFRGTAIDAVRAELRSQYDPKTGLLNYDSIMAAARREIEIVDRNSENHGLLLGRSDIDDFGEINPKVGQLKGDEIIREVAKKSAAAIRSIDYVGREGGEENLLVIPQDKNSGQFDLADSNETQSEYSGTREHPGERVRLAINSIPHPLGSGQLSVSIGMVEYSPSIQANEHETPEEKRARLDRELTDALVEVGHAQVIAKMVGKNRTVVARRDPEEGWLYHDITDNKVYAAVFKRGEVDPETRLRGPDLMRALENRTTGENFAVDSTQKKPKLVQVP